MIHLLAWYVVLSIAGWMAFPIAFRFLRALPDRGYTLARIFGLFLWSYSFWILASLGFIQNNPGGILVALGIVLGSSLWAFRTISLEEIRAWWEARRGLVLASEAVFLLAFAGWALVRAYNPEIAATEKPMELAFLNAIQRSPVFPPYDPWFSGYAISYYYFGYVMVAMLAQLTSTPAGIAFNLGIALIFGLSAMGAYGIVYNLYSMWGRHTPGRDIDRGAGEDGEIGRRAKSRGWGFLALLGPLYILIASNLTGLLEVLHARGIFWRVGEDGEWRSFFWRWLDMRELNQPPAEPLSWMPSRYNWWWRASRVLQDYNFAGEWKEVIDEFPFFSFLLADLHPHVLAIPFALLAIGLSMNLLWGGGSGHTYLLSLRVPLRWRAHLRRLSGRERTHIISLRVEVSKAYFLLSALALGGLAFLNTWDFPIYVGLFCGAYVLKRWHDTPAGDPWEAGGENAAEDGGPARITSGQLVKEFMALGLGLGLVGIFLYLPFYIGFSSQAGGVLPNLVYPTRGAHFWVMFGPMLMPMFAFLVYRSMSAARRETLVRAAWVSVGLLAALWGVSLAMGIFIAILPVVGDFFLDNLGAAGLLGDLVQESILRRFTSIGAWLTLGVFLALILGLLWPKGQAGKGMGENASPAHTFAKLLMLVGALVALFPEFVYLRDYFGTRMNTIFKFYYQTWLLWGIAAAYAMGVLVQALAGKWGTILKSGLFLLLGISFIYPALSLWTKTNGFNPIHGPTLDGTAYLERQSPDEVAAIRWLENAPPGVVVEAVGGSYTQYARVATHSGQPNLIGWPWHQVQWRGGHDEIGPRQSDVERIYRSGDWNEVRALLERYGVRYVFVGGLERSSYRVNETTFLRFLNLVFERGDVRIYEVPGF